jgi:hypothetical protein
VQHQPDEAFLIRLKLEEVIAAAERTDLEDALLPRLRQFGRRVVEQGDDARVGERFVPCLWG